MSSEGRVISKIISSVTTYSQASTVTAFGHHSKVLFCPHYQLSRERICWFLNNIDFSRETEAYHLSLLNEKPDYSDFIKPQEDVSDDAYLAQVLQYEYDREYDQQVNREEKLFNGNSKGRDSLLCSDSLKQCYVYFTLF